MSFNLRSAFGVALGIFVFSFVNILVFGFSIAQGSDRPLIGSKMFPILYFVFILLFLLIILMCIRSKLSSRASLISMLFLVAILSISAAYSSSSLKDYYSNNIKLTEQKNILIDELNAMESRIESYKSYSDAIVNLSNQYQENNANLKIQLNQLKVKKAEADAAIKEKQLEIEKEKLRLEQLAQQEQLSQQDELLQQQNQQADDYYYEYEDD
jgi:glucan phosphoethanolaminetransferase (alkaline phosphatase superfamily)